MHKGKLLAALGIVAAVGVLLLATWLALQPDARCDPDAPDPRSLSRIDV